MGKPRFFAHSAQRCSTCFCPFTSTMVWRVAGFFLQLSHNKPFTPYQFGLLSQYYYTTLWQSRNAVMVPCL